MEHPLLDTTDQYTTQEYLGGMVDQERDGYQGQMLVPGKDYLQHGDT